MRGTKERGGGGGGEKRERTRRYFLFFIMHTHFANGAGEGERGGTMPVTKTFREKKEMKKKGGKSLLLTRA